VNYRIYYQHSATTDVNWPSAIDRINSSPMRGMFLCGTNDRYFKKLNLIEKLKW
jgi:hypothetical protein